MKKTAFIVDSSSGIKNNQYQDVYVLPLIVNINNNGKINSFHDGIDIDDVQIAKHLESDNNDVKTSQASAGEIIKLVESVYEEYDRIYVIHIPSKISSSYNTWKMIEGEYNKIKVLKNNDVSLGTKWTIEHFIELKNKNKLNDEVVEQYLNEIGSKRFAALFVYDLKQLKKGGRVSNIKSIVVQLLGLKLTVFLDENGLNFFGANKSFIKSAQNAIIDFNKRHNNFDIKNLKHFGIVTTPYSKQDSSIMECINDMKNKIDKNIKIDEGSIPAVIMSHTGLKAFAFYFEGK
ncbi:MAG: DegV family protein [Candidatus Malacoplasma girerdii]|nr:MAG: DegV family protein [Candidatus Malacoplasma girerdii]